MVTTALFRFWGSTVTVKTVELDRNTLVTGLTKLSFVIYRYILVLVIFSRVTSDTAAYTNYVISVCSDTLMHGFITPMVQVLHVVATHILCIRDNAALQPGSA
jgi:hypothetical protein